MAVSESFPDLPTLRPAPRRHLERRAQQPSHPPPPRPPRTIADVGASDRPRHWPAPRHKEEAVRGEVLWGAGAKEGLGDPGPRRGHRRTRHERLHDLSLLIPLGDVPLRADAYALVGGPGGAGEPLHPLARKPHR